MKLHHRHSIVQRAKMEVSSAINKAETDHELTPIETVSILLDLADRYAMYALRFERHGNYAKKADDEVKRGEKLGLLHGIPTSIKDVLITKGIRTTFGTKIHENTPPRSGGPALDA